MKNKFMSFLNIFTYTKKVEPEVMRAYLNKLPFYIKVNWKREADGYIVGDIATEDYTFSTQGKNGDDFIEMVNDAVFTMYDVKKDHIDLLKKFYYIKPRNEEEMEKLKAKKIHSSMFEYAQVTT